MPSFAYTNQTNFRPFSYQEMLAPVLMATQAHQAVEEAYSELDSQANAVGSLADETNDPIAYQRYKAYEGALRQQADALAKNGLTPGSRQSLLGLKGRYAKDIIPIQNAVTRRRELADEQRKALLQNPTLMFQRDMNSIGYNSSLDRFLENANYDYGETYSGALLTQQVSQVASNLAKELINYGNGKRLDAYTKTFMQQHGFTRGQVLDAINNPNREQSQPVLSAIVEQVIGSSGMSNWADQSTMDKAYNYARQGLWSAIGQTNISTYEDYGARLAAQEAKEMRLKYSENLPLKGVKKPAVNALNIYSSRKLSEAEEKYNANVKNFSKYFVTDLQGRTIMTKEGQIAYNTKKYTPPTTSPTTHITVTPEKYEDSDFKKFIDEIGGKGSISSSGYGPNQGANIGKLWENYISNNPAARTARYDATKVTEFDYPIDSTQQKDIKNAIMVASRGTTLKEVDFDSKANQFKNTGNQLKLEDLNSDKYHVISTRFSPYGSTVMIMDSEGNTKRYRMPAGINTTNENNRDAQMAWAKVLQDNRAGGTIRIPDEYARANNIPIGTTITATAEQVAQEYDNAVHEALLFHSQIGLQNKTKEQEFSAYGY